MPAVGGGPNHSAYIVIEGPGHDGTRLPLREGITSFGRLPSNDVILLGDLVSRHHSRITFFEGRATLQDLGSHNGSWVNGEQVQSKVLKEGDVCRVGNFRVAFHPGEISSAGFDDMTAAEQQRLEAKTATPPAVAILPAQYTRRRHRTQAKLRRFDGTYAQDS